MTPLKMRERPVSAGRLIQRFLKSYVVSNRNTSSRRTVVIVRPARLPWRIIASLRRAPLSAKRRLALGGQR